MGRIVGGREGGESNCSEHERSTRRMKERRRRKRMRRKKGGGEYEAGEVVVNVHGSELFALLPLLLEQLINLLRPLLGSAALS